MIDLGRGLVLLANTIQGINKEINFGAREIKVACELDGVRRVDDTNAGMAAGREEAASARVVATKHGNSGLQMNSLQQTRASDAAKDGGVLCAEGTKLLLHLLAALYNVGAHLGGDGPQHIGRNIKCTWIGGHGVAVQPHNILGGNVLLHRQHGERILAGVEGLTIGLHVGGISICKARVVHNGERALGAQCGLNRVDDQERVGLLCACTSRIIKLARDHSTRLALAHDGLHVHGLHVQAQLLHVVKGLVQRLDIIGWDRKRQVAGIVLEASQVSLVDAAARVAEAGRAVGAAVERTLKHNHSAAAASMDSAGTGHELRVGISETSRELHSLRARVECGNARVGTALGASEADLLPPLGEKGLLRE
eukprot:m.228079 g.228079  ORF g.228079 m.228079 type:complete len:366 (+) comp17393_c0_seq1:1649-2746(+)